MISTPNNIMVQCSAPGTGAFTPASAVASFLSLAGVSTSDGAPYMAKAVDANGVPTGDWESGIGTWNGTTLARSVILGSSNAGAAVNFTGTTFVMVARQCEFMDCILAADSSNSTTTPANVSGMAFPVAASGIYEVELIGAYQTAATTTGIAVDLDIPSGQVIGMIGVATSATALGGTEQIADAATTGATTGVRAATTNTPIWSRWIVVVGATGGTCQLQLRSEVASSAVTLKASLTVLKARRIS